MATPDSLCSGRVISVCSDSLLRSTRQLVLSLRFVTVSVATAAELKLFAGEEIDVVILCHSLAPQELESAIQIALQQWKPAQNVVLTRTNTACRPLTIWSAQLQDRSFCCKALAACCRTLP